MEFQLEQGYILGIVGRIGSGKTTLMKRIIKDYNKEGLPIKINGTIGVVMEDVPFLLDDTLDENARVFGILCDEYSKEEFHRYLKRVGLEGHKIYGLLSKGEKIKFQLAFAMSINPRVLILDEPTAGLDVVFRKQFLYMIQEMVEEKMISVIISTHLTEDLDKVADYIGYMENMELKFVREKWQLLEEYKEKNNIQVTPTLSKVILEVEKNVFE